MYGSVLLEVGDDLAHDRGRNGKRVAGIATGLGVDGGIDTYQLAGGVDQCTATVTGVHGCIGLDEGLDTHLLAVGVESADATGFGADDTGRHGRGKSQRVTYGQYPFAHFQIVRIAEFDDGQVFGIDFNQGQVGRGVGTDYPAVEGTVVVQGDVELVGPFDHVVVGHDISVGGDDYTRTQTRTGLRLDVTAALSEEVFEEGVGKSAHLALLGGRGRLDAHHGIDRVFGRYGKVGLDSRMVGNSCEAGGLCITAFEWLILDF